LDELYREGEAGQPKMMSVGLHPRIVGRPARIAALRKFLEYATSKQDVWFATREQIAGELSDYTPSMEYVANYDWLLIL
jgi:peptidoglycan/xylan/chitin deacetylase (PgdA/CDA1 family)